MNQMDSLWVLNGNVDLAVDCLLPLGRSNGMERMTRCRRLS